MAAEAPAVELAAWLAGELLDWSKQIERDLGDASSGEVVISFDRPMRNVVIQSRITRTYRKRKDAVS